MLRRKLEQRTTNFQFQCILNTFYVYRTFTIFSSPTALEALISIIADGNELILNHEHAASVLSKRKPSLLLLTLLKIGPTNIN